MTDLIDAVGQLTRAGKLRAPKRRPDATLRSRKLLTKPEIERLTATARLNKHGHRDATMIDMTFRHGLRATELMTCDGTRLTFVQRPWRCAGSIMVCQAPIAF